jgi:hypothetical protein
MLEVGSREMSIRAGVSNTIQIASPRRKTAAPAGAAQSNDRVTCWSCLENSGRTTPPAGIGLGRPTSAAAAGAWAAGDAPGLAKMLTKSTPSALPRRASASSVRVTTISSTPLTWRASDDFTQRGGAIVRVDRSGLASRLNRITRVWPSR